MCYDRMQHLAVSICCQWLGMLLVALVCMQTMLQRMRFYIHTGHGESLSYYGAPSPVPFQGSCQSNKAAPGFWITISLVLVQYLAGRGYTEELHAAILLSVVLLVVIMFVDDTNLPIVR